MLTQVTPTSMRFENPAHDFPTAIQYTRRPDGSLETVVSGPGGSRAITTVHARRD